MIPAAPAAGIVCPIIDLTDPMAAGGSAPPGRRPKTLVIAAISVWSPSGMPVPWHSISPGWSGAAGSCPASTERALYRQDLALEPWRQQARSLAVGGLADPLEHRVDPVTVPRRVLGPLEREDTQPLAHQRAVTPLGEGAHMARARQRPQLVEQHVDLGRDGGVHAAGQHHVGPAGTQFGHCRLDRQVCRRAGRVDQEVGPVQVEPVGDAPRHHVGHQPGRDVGVNFGNAIGQRGTHPVSSVSGGTPGSSWPSNSRV